MGTEATFPPYRDEIAPCIESLVLVFPRHRLVLVGGTYGGVSGPERSSKGFFQTVRFSVLRWRREQQWVLRAPEEKSDVLVDFRDYLENLAFVCCVQRFLTQEARPI